MSAEPEVTPEMLRYAVILDTVAMGVIEAIRPCGENEQLAITAVSVGLASMIRATKDPEKAKALAIGVIEATVAGELDHE